MSDAIVLNGDCLEVLKTLPDNSIDSLVTDPPAGISFMGKKWDGDRGGREHWIAWMRDVLKECLRVMKPGAHGLVWAIPRTSHWTATACEDAGFEIRDVVTHLFGSGFPKSHDISKAIDKAPSTDAAKQWQGWGTALKPASEHWILIRKPISEKTVAANVLKWGCGALNIDASRIGFSSDKDRKAAEFGSKGGGDGWGMKPGAEVLPTNPMGRFPANLVLSCSEFCTDDTHDIECAIAVLDAQSGPCKTGNIKAGTVGGFGGSANIYGAGLVPCEYNTDAAVGASRFFYCAKASKSDKNAGCDMGTSKAVGNRPNSGDATGKFPDHDPPERVGNFHPTVKSTKLMSYLITMVTPPGGLVLDPFTGSGSTGVACVNKGFAFIGIEKESEYATIAEARLLAAEAS